jgi:hypothetical protein
MDESNINMRSKMITHKQDGIRQQNVDKKIKGKQSIERTFSGTILVRLPGKMLSKIRQVP